MFPDRFTHVPVSFVSQSAAYTAKPFEYVLLTATAADYTLTLPTSPTVNDVVSMSATSITGGFKVTVTGTTKNILLREGSATSFKLFITNDHMDLKYNGTAWEVTNDGRKKHVGVMRNSVAQTISNGVFTVLGYDTLVVDHGGIATIADERITALRDGSYNYRAQSIPENTTLAASDRIITRLYKNGSHFQAGEQDEDSSGDRHTTVAAGIIELLAGNYIDARIYYLTGGNCDTEANYSHFQVFET